MNARLEGTLVNYETDRSKLEAARLLQLQAMAEREKYMERTLTLQRQLLDKEEVLEMVVMGTANITIFNGE